MATRKQRRRREKEHRHEYEVVFLDSAGNEVEPPPGEEPRRAKAGPPAKGGSSERRSSGGVFGRGPIQPPSWRRVIRRGLIFTPIFLAVLLLLGGGKVTIAGALVQALFLLAVFVPFSYLVDRTVWRSQQKRLARGG